MIQSLDEAKTGCHTHTSPGLSSQAPSGIRNHAGLSSLVLYFIARCCPSNVGSVLLPSDAGPALDQVEDTTWTLHGLGGMASSCRLMQSGERPWSLAGQGQ